MNTKGIAFPLALLVLGSAAACSSAPTTGGGGGTGGSAAGAGGSTGTSPSVTVTASATSSTSGAGTTTSSGDTTSSTSAGSSTTTTTTTSGGTGGGPPVMPKIHDDFEAATLGSLWKVTDPYGNPGQSTTAVIDTTKSKSGKNSLKVTDGFVGTASPGSTFYGRVWLWMEKDPGTGHWADFIGLGPNVKGSGTPTEVRFGGQFGILQANYFGDDSLALANNNYFNDNMTAGYTPPIAKWSCFEFYYGKDEIRLWLDGTEFAKPAGNPPYPGLHVTTKWPNGSAAAPWSPAYDTVRIGFHNYGGSQVVVWYDDVAFDTNKIGCN